MRRKKKKKKNIIDHIDCWAICFFVSYLTLPLPFPPSPLLSSPFSFRLLLGIWSLDLSPRDRKRENGEEGENGEVKDTIPKTQRLCLFTFCQASLSLDSIKFLPKTSVLALKAIRSLWTKLYRALDWPFSTLKASPRFTFCHFNSLIISFFFFLSSSSSQPSSYYCMICYMLLFCFYLVYGMYNIWSLLDELVMNIW